MKLRANTVAPLSLLITFFLLVLLIPGGPIENRDFSHLSPTVVWLFNGLITLVGMGSLVAVYLMVAGSRFGYVLGITSGSTFVLLSLLDILQIFPKSPTPMSPLLLGFEVAILILSVVVVVSSYRVLTSGTVEGVKVPLKRTLPYVLLLTVLGILAVIWASLAILGK